MAYQVKKLGVPTICFFGGAPSPPPAQDTSMVQMQREKEAQEAATKERVRRAQTSGAASLLNTETGYLGVGSTPLGTSA